MFDGQYNGTGGEPIDHFLGPGPAENMPSLMSECFFFQEIHKLRDLCKEITNTILVELHLHDSTCCLPPPPKKKINFFLT